MSTSAHSVHAALSCLGLGTVPPGLVEEDKCSWIISEVITPRAQSLCVGTLIIVALRIRHLTQTREFAGLLSPSHRLLTLYPNPRIQCIAGLLHRMYGRSSVDWTEGSKWYFDQGFLSMNGRRDLERWRHAYMQMAHSHPNLPLSVCKRVSNSVNDASHLHM